jgi:hypothetical protein
MMPGDLGVRESRLPVAVFLLAGCLAGLPVFAERLPSGTEMTLRLDNEVVPGSSRTQHFSALVSYSVFAGGREVLPAGSRVEGEVRGDKKHVMLSPRYLISPGGQRIDFNAAIKAIDRKKLRAEEKEGTISPRGQSGGATQQAAEIGATGAIIGAMSTGTAKGAGIGAAAGVAAVLIGRKVAGRGRTAVIPAGTQLTVSLSRPLDLPDTAAAAPAQDPAQRDRTDDPSDRRPVLRRREP